MNEVPQIAKEMLAALSELAPKDWRIWVHTALLVFLILLFFKIISVFVVRFLKDKTTVATSQLVAKIIRNAALVIAGMTILDALGIDLSAVMGAAGIAGIAVGFAAQTSVSNIISGLFLLSEKPFTIGDTIQTGDISGTVLSIDFLSIKIQTFDNRFVRIPNETIIKSNVVNVTRFPIRRLEIRFTVAFDTDLAQVQTVLTEIARQNVYALDVPEPVIIFDQFDSAGVAIMLGIWFEKSNLLSLKNSVMMSISEQFKKEGIQFSFIRLSKVE